MPLFQFLVPNSATHKDGLKTTSVDSEQFFRNLINIGIRQGLKDGTAIVGCTLQPGGRLELKYVDQVTAIILDVDGKNEIVQSDWIFSRLGYRGIAHTSYNHRADHPKFRVILPLAEPISPAQHYRLWYFLFEKLEKKIDPACKDCSRLFYLPRIPNEAVRAEHWIKVLEGPYLSMSVVPENFNPSDGTVFQAPKKKQGAHGSVDSGTYVRRNIDVNRLLEKLLELPLYKWAIENPSDVTYEIWRGLATNIAAAVLETPEHLQAGAEAFHTISASDENRYNFAATEKAFKHALKSAQHPGPMTYANLELNGVPAEICSELNYGHKSPIAQARSMVRDIAIVKGEESTTKVEVALKPEQPVVQTKTPAVVEKKEQPADEDEEPEEDDIFNHSPNDFLHDMLEDKFIMRNKVGGWEGPFTPSGLSQQLLNWGLPRMKQDAFRSQIKSYQRRECIFSTEDFLVEQDGVYIFNEYKKPQLKAIPGNWDDIMTCLLNLVNGDVKACDYVIDWIAMPVQNLYKLDGNDIKLNKGHLKMGTACVFSGIEGAGKGTLEQILTTIYGVDNVSTIGQEALDGRFNGELANKLFIVANEVMSSTNRSSQTANKIKPWVTDEYIPVEEKFKGAQRTRNTFNIIFTSNDERPVIISKTDRRFSVFKSVVPLDKDVSDRIYADLRGDKKMVFAFLHHLLTRTVKRRFGEIYHTDSRIEMMRMSGTSDEKFVDEIQREGWLAVSAEWVESANAHVPREAVVNGHSVLADTLNKVYQSWCNRHNVKARNQICLGKSLKEKFPDIDAQRITYGGIQRRAWLGIPMQPIDEQQVVKKEAPANEAQAKPTDDADFG